MYCKRHGKFHTVLALLLSFTLIVSAVFGSTFAYLVTKTPSFINTFLSGLHSTGDLVIRKEVSHPFGGSYVLPDGLSFSFEISLGSDFAGETVETSLGDLVADEEGKIDISIVPDRAVRIKDLPEGTPVTVTEVSYGLFTPEDGAEKAVTIQSGVNTIVYTNTYTPGPADPSNLTVTGTKLLEGREWQAGDSFTFRLDYKLADSGQEWKSVGTETEPVTVTLTYDPEKPDSNQFSLTELVRSVTYSCAGVYSFRVYEVTGNVPGMIYEKSVGYFDVTVGDRDMDGALEIQNVTGYQNTVASYDEDAKTHHVGLTVTNRYEPNVAAKAEIQIHKTVTSLSGMNQSAAGFTFALYDEANNLVATSNATSASGETSITLTYSADDAGKTFHYYLKEIVGENPVPGMIYSDAVYPISVSVVENQDGTIYANVYNTDQYQTELIEIEPEETEPEETEPVETEPEETEPEETEPEETEPEETEPEETEPVETEPVETEPVVTEPNETVPEATVELIVEIMEELVPLSDTPDQPDQEPDPAEEEPPVDPPSEPKTKEVIVIPEGASHSYTAYFVNMYDPVDTTASFGGSKTLTGREMKTGEFTFDLFDVGGDFEIHEDQQPIQSVTNDADGNFAFETIDYSRVGVYHYVVKEDTSAKLGGIIYDENRYHVIVTVTDVDGKLNAEVSMTNVLGSSVPGIEFENSYKFAPATIPLSGQKELTGKSLAANMFQFHLHKADENYSVQGAVMAGASNDASGNFTFNRMKLSEPGIFYYVVTEDASAVIPGMTYDDTVYGVKVSVWDDGSGILQSTVTLTKVGGGEVDTILFKNSYTKPIDPEPSKPTGPSDPTESTAPEVTTEPTDPTESTAPTETTRPTDPSDPTKPSTPVDPTVPPTDDNNRTELYFALVVISIIAIVSLLIPRKKRHKSRYLK